MRHDDSFSERYRGRNRGMFGYEGEGYLQAEGRDVTPEAYRDVESSPSRGWNIGEASDRGDRPSYRGLGPRNYRRLDERIREEVCERLMLDDEVDATDIEVSVSDGVVTLDGTVPERFAKRAAEDLAERVRGVSEVRNRLRLSG